MTISFKELLGTEKPIIAMAHFPAMPGSPLHDVEGGVKKVEEWVRADVEALIEGGVDAIMFCNEGDRPYVVGTVVESVAVMSAVVSRIAQDLPIPFGVDILWDPIGAIALAKATGARFVREVFTGVYSSDMGVWDTNCAAALRYRDKLHAEDIKLFFNINAEFAAAVGERPLDKLAKSVVFSSLADALCVSGPMTGESVDLSDLETVKKAVDVPVIANTGVREANVGKVLEVADAAIVGTALKIDGCTWNHVDAKRVKRFMKVARG
ncbi:MAG TPA: SgcQ protein [Firmicutes bacterium]|jgi:membrane complex biogenesis BtpA family protein|nr:SgcQ protein [Bacillota bacterium]